MLQKVMNVLLVEDNPGDAQLAKEAFGQGEIAVELTVIDRGDRVLPYLRGEGEPVAALPDLVVLDLNMPVVDGRELLAQIKGDALLKVIPVIVLSTSISPADVNYCYDNHANCYISKPVTMTQFQKVVEEVERFWFRTVRCAPRPVRRAGGS